MYVRTIDRVLLKHGDKELNGLKSDIGYQKWHWTSLKYYKVWNNK